MITVKQVSITKITLLDDGTLDYNLADASFAIPVHVKRVTAIGINPHMKRNGYEGVVGGADITIGTFTLVDSDGNVITELLVNNSSFVSMKINRLLRQVDPKSSINGGEILRLIPQFSKEIIQALSNQGGVLQAPFLASKPEIYVDVYLKYD